MLLVFTLDTQHCRLGQALGLPKDFVVHSLRHTMLTRLGEAGADAFTIMRIAGHSTVTVSRRYVHPSPEALENAFELLERLNGKAAKVLPPGSEKQVVPTISPTFAEAPQTLAS
jgi:integrase